MRGRKRLDSDHAGWSTRLQSHLHELQFVGKKVNLPSSLQDCFKVAENLQRTELLQAMLQLSAGLLAYCSFFPSVCKLFCMLT